LTLGRAFLDLFHDQDARGLALLDAILSGEDAAFEPGGYPDEGTAVLGRLDEDFLYQGGNAPAAAPGASTTLRFLPPM
jgi:hypothetical protein